MKYFVIILYFFVFACEWGFAEIADVSLRRTPVVKAVEKVSPAVVNINTERTVVARQYPFENGLSLEEWFFGVRKPNYAKKNVPLSIGSGVIIHPKGYVLTNEHILLRASKITVQLKDGRNIAASVVGSDPSSDIAVLKLEPSDEEAKNFPYIQPGNSDGLMIGEPVIAIGNPFGLSNTVTTGVVSALSRQLETEAKLYDDFIQTDASINPGNSGGPLLNILGELIGINTAIFHGGRGREAEGIGFAIPINFAKRIVGDLLEYGQVLPAYVGFRIWQQSGALWVSHVEKTGPAEDSGVRAADQLTSCQKKQLHSEHEFRALIRRLQPGTLLDCTFLSVDQPKPRRTRISTKNFPADFADLFIRQYIGVDLQETPSGLLIRKVFADTPAAKVGLKSGDYLLQMNDSKLKSLKILNKLVPNLYYQSSMLVMIERRKNIYYASLSFHP